MRVDRPNNLWYCADQQRFDPIGALGYSGVDTPTIDSLVRSGVAFKRAYAQSTICTPSRASFLTGQHAGRMHVNRNGNDDFPEQPRLISRLLANAGNEFGLVGKRHLTRAYRRVETLTDDGYRYWKWSHAPRDNRRQGHDYADWLHGNGESLKTLTQLFDGAPAELHQTTWASDGAIDSISEKRDAPWMLSDNIYDPNPPFGPTVAYREMFDSAAMPDPGLGNQDHAMPGH